MSLELSPEAVALKMRRKKLEAIDKGQRTTFSFLVGPDESTAEVSFKL